MVMLSSKCGENLICFVAKPRKKWSLTVMIVHRLAKWSLTVLSVVKSSQILRSDFALQSCN